MIENVSFPSRTGATVNAALALPSGDAKGPAVVLLHEWWGLNAHIRSLLTRLADAGFAQSAQLPLEHAAPANIKKAFGHALGQRQEPAALAGAEDQGALGSGHVSFQDRVEWERSAKGAVHCAVAGSSSASRSAPPSVAALM